MQKYFAPFCAAAFALAVLAGCAGNPNSSVARKCQRDLDTGYKELDFAKSKGFSGTVAWSKAASLLSTAKVQHELEYYQSCIDKVRSARQYIIQSQRS